MFSGINMNVCFKILLLVIYMFYNQNMLILEFYPKWVSYIKEFDILLTSCFVIILF